MMSALSKFVGYLSRFFLSSDDESFYSSVPSSSLLQAATARRAMSTFVYVDGEGDAFAGRPGRKPVQRRTVDYTATTVRHVEVRPVAIATSAPPPPPAFSPLLPAGRPSARREKSARVAHP